MYTFQQTKRKDCGFTCMKMLLANVFNDVRYRYVTNDKTESLSLAQLVEIAGSYNVVLDGYKFNMYEISTLKPPFILSYAQNENYHSVYVYKIRRSVLFVVDPADGKKRKIMVKDPSILNAVILTISSVGENCCDFILPRTRNAWLTASFIIAEFLSFICVLAAFVEYKPQGSVILTASFLGSSVLFSLLSKIITKLSLDDFDKRVAYRNLHECENKEEYYNLCNDFKIQVNVSSSINIINIIQTITICVLTALWSVWILIPMASFIVASIFVRVMRDRMEARIIKNLESSERSLLLSKTIIEVELNAKTISKDSSTIFFLRFIMDFFPLFVVVVFVVVFLSFQREFLMTNALFLVASIFMIKSKVEQISSFFLNRKRNIVKTDLITKLIEILNKKTPS